MTAGYFVIWIQTPIGSTGSGSLIEFTSGIQWLNSQLRSMTEPAHLGGSLWGLRVPALLILAKHLIQNDRMQVVAAIFDRAVVTSGPGSHAHFFDSINIEGAFLFQDCLRAHNSSFTASRYQTHF